MSDLDLTINQIINKYNILSNNNTKSMGQNFIRDETLLDKIAKCALPITGDIVEIGPGPTGLTRSILKFCTNNICTNNIICIEKDIRFKNIHDNLLLHFKNLTFIYDDALNIRLKNISKNNVVIIANLPYNIGTALLMNWLLYDINKIDKMILMFQKEVAERICANVGNKNYGKISILAQLLCKTQKLFNISNKAFIPQPKVMSSVILLQNSYKKFENMENLISLLNICFQHRRKMIGSILSNYINNAETILLENGINPKQRPETILPEQFYNLSKIINKEEVI